MFSSTVILLFSLVTFPLNLRVSGCGDCTDKPVFSPTHLVVKYGDPASATCTACQSECLGNYYNIEHTVGDVEKNGTRLHWKTDNLTQWRPVLMCYYNDASGNQCCTNLPVTLYRPPDKVSISFRNHTGPLVVGNMYTLQCTVENAAPFENVEAVFYKGDSAFSQVQLTSETDKKPMTKSIGTDLFPLESNNGAEYWCEAVFKLGSGRQQRPPVGKSQRTTAIVHYKPEFQVSYDSTWITLTEGNKLQLNCTSVGNPSPSYNWTLPSGRLSPSRDSVFIIESVAVEDEGQYLCIVSNGYGTIREDFMLQVIRDYTLYIILAALALVVLLIFIGVLIYFRCYKPSRMGRYNLLNVLFRKGHSAVPTTE